MRHRRQRHARQDHHHLDAGAGVFDRRARPERAHRRGTGLSRRFHAARQGRVHPRSLRVQPQFFALLPHRGGHPQHRRGSSGLLQGYRRHRSDVFAVRASGEVHRRLGRRRARKARHRAERPSPHHLRAGRGKHAATGRAFLRRTRSRPLHRPLEGRAHRRIFAGRARGGQHARRAGRHRRGAVARSADGRGFRGAAQFPRRAPAQRTDQRHRRRKGVYRLWPQPRRDQIGAGHRRHGAAQDPLGRVAAAHLFAHQDAV